jgi:putative membrane protein
VPPDKRIIYRRANMPTAAKVERILVLCVDRDDDLGMKAGINTPVLGRKENVNAAASLALRDPEEADANAMFEAVRIYDNLKKNVKGQEEHEVATIAGSDLEGVEADRQLVAELTEVLNEFPATDVILVTDGYTDEMVLPLIESRVPVTSVRRIVIQHSKSIEESAALFSRYMKVLVENPRYSRMLLGLPGILLIVLGVLWYFDLLSYAGQALAIVLGTFLFVRGFRLDKTAHNFIKWIREYSPPPFTVQIAGFSAIAGILLILVAGYLGGTAVANVAATLADTGADPFAQVPRLIGEFLYGSTYLIAIGICVILSGRAVRLFFERDLRLWLTIVIVVGVAWSSVMFVEASQILINPDAPYYTLVYAIVGGIPVIVSTVLTVLLLRRRYSSYFKETKDVIEDFEES